MKNLIKLLLQKKRTKGMTVGILTSGGDCQALNAAMRGVAKSLYEKKKDIQILGIEDGFKGLCQNKVRKMEKKDFSGILSLGGTILGSSRMPFKQIEEDDEDGINKIQSMISCYRKNKMDCLVVLGGNGSHKTANLLREKGLNIITLPKTIDNDIWGTDMTFGFYSALEIASKAIDCIHTTAASHSRVFIIEIMGHKTGWLSLYAGIAGGADIILIPEIPYSIQSVVKKIQEREQEGRNFTIIVCAEGAISKENVSLPKKEYRRKLGGISISFHLASEIKILTGKDIRVTIPGHTQRGGEPCPADRVLATRLGAATAEYIMAGKFGVMTALKNGNIEPVPLSEVAGKLKTVPQDSPIIREAKSLGISFGE